MRTDFCLGDRRGYGMRFLSALCKKYEVRIARVQLTTKYLYYIQSSSNGNATEVTCLRVLSTLYNWSHVVGTVRDNPDYHGMNLSKRAFVYRNQHRLEKTICGGWDTNNQNAEKRSQKKIKMDIITGKPQSWWSWRSWNWSLGNMWECMQCYFVLWSRVQSSSPAGSTSGGRWQTFVFPRSFTLQGVYWRTQLLFIKYYEVCGMYSSYSTCRWTELGLDRALFILFIIAV